MLRTCTQDPNAGRLLGLTVHDWRHAHHRRYLRRQPAPGGERLPAVVDAIALDQVDAAPLGQGVRSPILRR